MELTKVPEVDASDSLRVIKSQSIDTRLTNALARCDKAEKLGIKEVVVGTQVIHRNVEIEFLMDKLNSSNKALYAGLSEHGRKPMLHAKITEHPDKSLTYDISIVVNL